MSPDLVKAINLFLSARIPTLEQLDISWFGGEPLLALDVIRNISDNIKAHRRNNESMSYDANITTNAYFLDAPTFDELVEHGITFFQVSLDGSEEQHNKTRLKANGTGTFERIWRNLLSIRDNGKRKATVVLRVHFTPTTWESLDPLIDLINNELSRDPRFVVYFKAIERLGGTNDPNIRTFTYKAQAEVKQSLVKKLACARMIYSHIANASGRYICYASKANSFAIRANGRIAKCTVGLHDPRNDVGYLSLDGQLIIDNEHIRLWLAGLQSNDSTILACPFRRMQTTIKSDVGREELIAT
jgi:uncharacterized protein